MKSIFEEQCAELNGKLTEVLAHYPKSVAVFVLPAVLATIGVPRATLLQMYLIALSKAEPATPEKESDSR